MPNTIADNLARLQAANADIASAIADKGVTVPSGSGLEDYADLIATIEGGGGGDTPPDPNKPVKIYDYDGTLYKSYTVTEFLQRSLPELQQFGWPEPPDHTDIGLVSRWYNWDFGRQEAEEYVSRYGMLNVCNTVEDSDGAQLRLEVTLREDTLHPQIYISTVDNASVVTVYWGDSTSTEYYPQTPPRFDGESLTVDHQYLTHGDYTIKVVAEGYFGDATIGLQGVPLNSGVDDTVTSSLFSEYGQTSSRKYAECVKKAFIGNHVGSIYGTFCGFTRLETCTFTPDTTTDYMSREIIEYFNIDRVAFYNCIGLKFISFPMGLYSIGNAAFYGCSNLETVVMPSSCIIGYNEDDDPTNPVLYSSIRYISGGAFYHCSKLTTLLLPDGGIDSPYDQSTYDGIDIGQIFYDSNSSFMYLTPPIKTLVLPKYSKGYNYYYELLCYNHGLENLIISESIAQISNSFINQCTNLKTIKFMAADPPTMTYGASFDYLPKDTKIYVPQASLAAYQAASNYPDPTVWEYIGY